MLLSRGGEKKILLKLFLIAEKQCSYIKELADAMKKTGGE